MRLSIFVYCFLPVFLVFSLLQRPTLAVPKSYIVYLGSSPSNGRRLAADPDAVTNSHLELLSSVLKRNVKADDALLLYSYNTVIDGFAAVLQEEEAQELAKNPKVLSVFESQLRKLHTTRSFEFLGLGNGGVVPDYSAWKKANYGEKIIIANLDTGVWPESRSFTDEGMGPIPVKFKGICQNENDPTFHCNRKLIGARYFYKGFAEQLVLFNKTFNHTLSPRDTEGHGTHTLSTAGGNSVTGVDVDGFGNGTATGGSPKAHVVAYKVCWPSPSALVGGCSDIDILAALEAAIDDDVDVISLSVGGPPTDYLNSSIAIGSFHAVKNGIPVVASAGNDGPKPGSVTNVAPWILTVGASTIDRAFVGHVTLGSNITLKGASRTQKGLLTNKFYPLITGSAARFPTANSTAAAFCLNGTVDPLKAKGNILVCLRGEGPRMDKSYEAARTGAIGIILVNIQELGTQITADDYPLPGLHLTFPDGEALFSYLNSTLSPVATIASGSTELGAKPAPYMADFSSRGPNTITPEILKPDITAPGVSIIAALSEEGKKPAAPYGLMDGTSMSCPHIAGIVGLLKAAYPHWSPSEIKSAIMTTASTRDNTRKTLLDYTHKKATPFDYGAGHVRPNQAVDPGLVYDMDHHDYLNFLCAIGYNKQMIKKFSKHSYYCPDSVSVANLNYPTITIPDFTGKATINRRVKNVGQPSTYSARIKAPAGLSITVEPKTLAFTKKGQELEYHLIFKAAGGGTIRDYSFGHLVWSDGKHDVRSSIIVKHKAL